MALRTTAALALLLKGDVVSLASPVQIPALRVGKKVVPVTNHRVVDVNGQDVLVVELRDVESRDLVVDSLRNGVDQVALNLRGSQVVVSVVDVLESDEEVVDPVDVVDVVVQVLDVVAEGVVVLTVNLREGREPFNVAV